MEDTIEIFDETLEDNIEVQEESIYYIPNGEVDINSNGIYDVANYSKAIVDVTDWSPKQDWWDIKKIIEEDTEDYPAKIILLLNDAYKYINLESVNFYETIAKVKYSDGFETTQQVVHKISDDGIKTCSKGYGTWYAIIYLNSTTTNFMSYLSFRILFPSLIYTYFYNIEDFGCNSSFKIDYMPYFEAWESNKPFIISGNMICNISTSPKLQVLPQISVWNRRQQDINFANFLYIEHVPLLTKKELLKYFDFKKISYGNENNNSAQILNDCLIGENVDLEKDFGWNFENVTRISTLQGMSSIKKLDFSNTTSYYGKIYVPNIDEVVGIKLTNCNIFQDTNQSRETLVKILNALEDYSNGSTHTLILGKNISKLSDEELAIATNKNWTVS